MSPANQSLHARIPAHSSQDSKLAPKPLEAKVVNTCKKKEREKERSKREELGGERRELTVLFSDIHIRIKCVSNITKLKKMKKKILTPDNYKIKRYHNLFCR